MDIIAGALAPPSSAGGKAAEHVLALVVVAVVVGKAVKLGPRGIYDAVLSGAGPARRKRVVIM